MTLELPQRGHIINYRFLWEAEAAQGLEDAKKARPSAVLLTTEADEDGAVTVYVLPITHSRPTDNRNAIEIPPQVAKTAGLDDEQCWIITNQLNVFTWPGFDLEPVGGGLVVSLGKLPPGIAQDMVLAVEENIRDSEIVTINRD